MRRVVADSACYRQLQTVHLSAGLELYGYGAVSGAVMVNVGSGYTVAPAITFSAPPTGTTAVGFTLLSSTTTGQVGQVVVTNGGSGYLTAPTCTIAPPSAGVTATATPSIISPTTLDVLNITVLWGTQRITLDRRSFTSFQATVRSWQGFTQRPAVCASYGQANWYIGPLPDQYYLSEWDSIIAPPDLVNTTDVSVISYPYSDTVQYYAAHIAKYQEQSYGEADKFLEIYQQKIKHAIRSVMMRMLPSVYGS